jgi:Tol biopolymer transport system component
MVNVGESISDTLAAVLRTDPDWSTLPKETPVAVRRLLRRCLQRDRKKRLHDIADARLELEEVIEGPADVPTATAQPLQRSIPGWLFALVGALAILGLAVAVVHFREPAAAAPQVVRFDIPIAKSVTRIAVSPDGRTLAFIGSDDGDASLSVRALDSLNVRKLAAADRNSPVFWSPDSRSIAFVQDAKLRRIDLLGGTPQTLCSITGTVAGGTWSRDGVILYGSLPNGGGLFRVSAEGGEPVQVTKSDTANGETTHAFPQFLPDGKHFLYFRYYVDLEKTAVYVGSLDGTSGKRLLRTRTAAVYVPTNAQGEAGQVLFAQDGNLMTQQFDTESLSLTGEAVVVAEQVTINRNYGFFTASANGTMAYRTGAIDSGNRELVWVDRTGKRLNTVGTPGTYTDLALSPNNKTIAVSQSAALTRTGGYSNRDLWLLDTRGMATRFTTDPAPDVQPVWTPDGTRIAFASNRRGPPHLLQKPINGTGTESVLLKTENSLLPYGFSPDGQLLLYVALDPKTKTDLWSLPMTGERKPAPVRITPFNEGLARFSPVKIGGRQWVSYTSDESGRFEVYVTSFSGLQEKYLISKGGGTQAVWRKDGKELFYLAPGGTLMSVNITGATPIDTGVPTALFQTRMNVDVGPFGPPGWRYDVSADGQRFLVNQDVTPSDTPAALTIVLNWPSHKTR